MRRLDDNTRGDNAVMDGLPGLAATSPVAGI